MPICGNCHNPHDNVQAVKDCYAGIDMVRDGQAFQLKTKSPSVDLRAKAQSIPNARYALMDNDGGPVQFYEVRQGKKTQAGRDWTGVTFLDRLYGAPGEFRHVTIRRNTDQYRDVIMDIAESPQDALRLFGQKTKTCGKCASPLTHPQSRCAGYGGKCAANYGYWYPTLAEALEILGEVEMPDGTFTKKPNTEAQRLADAKQPQLSYDVTNVR